LLITALALLLITAAALGFLWKYLEDYQQTRPEVIADNIYQAYKNGDAAQIAALCSNLPTVFEDTELFKQYLKDNISNKEIYYYKGSSSSEDEICYEFTVMGEKFASLTQVKTGKKSTMGFDIYEAQSIVGHPLYTYSITLPQDAKAFINGSALDEKYLTETVNTAEELTEAGFGPFPTSEYLIDDFNYINEFSVEFPDKYNIVRDGNDITVTRIVSEQDKQAMAEFADKFVDVYMRFAVAAYGPRDPVLEMSYPDTKFYKAVQTYTNEWGEYYAKYEFKNYVIDDFCRYSDTEYSCHVTLDYVITDWYGQEKNYPFDAVFYITSKNGSMQIAAMKNN